MIGNYRGAHGVIGPTKAPGQRKALQFFCGHHLLLPFFIYCTTFGWLCLCLRTQMYFFFRMLCLCYNVLFRRKSPVAKFLKLFSPRCYLFAVFVFFLWLLASTNNIFLFRVLRRRSFSSVYLPLMHSLFC